MNYYGAWRTNYFKVKDPADFMAFCARWHAVRPITRERPDETLHGCTADLTADDSGTLPCQVQAPDHPEADDHGWVLAAALDDCPEFIEELGQQLAEGWVAIVKWGGREGLRYIDGGAIAIDSNGEMVSLTLNHIYLMVKPLGTVTPTHCEY